MLLPYELVADVLSYDRESGILTWKASPGRRPQWNACWAGKPAGSLMDDGYIRVSIRGQLYGAHRVCWLLETGAWPVGNLNHRDTVRSNNRFDNLRPATRAQNCQNTGISKANTSGFKGVCYNRTAGKWQSQIRKDGKRTYLGLFGTAEEAHAAYCRAATEMHGEFARHA